METDDMNALDLPSHSNTIYPVLSSYHHVCFEIFMIVFVRLNLCIFEIEFIEI